VGDPKNGNVGWIKSNELIPAETGTNGFSFSQQITSGGNQPRSVLMQFNPQAFSPEQSKALVKQIQAQQAQIQEHLHQVMKDFYSNGGVNSPIILPVMVMPVQTTPAVQK
jgi:hypothetical protein